VLICRTRVPLPDEVRAKISLFTDVAHNAVIESLDVDTIYEIPLLFERAGLARLVLRRLGLPDLPPDLSDWEHIVERLKHPRARCRIALVGKYIENRDSYISIAESFQHAGRGRTTPPWKSTGSTRRSWSRQTRRSGWRVWTASWSRTGSARGGVEGKTTRDSLRPREPHPLLRHLLRMQMAVIEFARHVVGLDGAHTRRGRPQHASSRDSPAA
jgi:CTP synthase